MESGKSTKSSKSLVIYSQEASVRFEGFRVRWKDGIKHKKHTATNVIGRSQCQEQGMKIKSADPHEVDPSLGRRLKHVKRETPKALWPECHQTKTRKIVCYLLSCGK